VETITPVIAGVLGARFAVTVQCDSSERKEPKTAKSHTLVFLASLRAEENSDPPGPPVNTGASIAATTITQARDDASAWQKYRHPHRRPKAALNLALTRNALLAIIPFEQCAPLAHFIELYRRSPAQALNLILHGRANIILPAKRAEKTGSKCFFLA